MTILKKIHITVILLGIYCASAVLVFVYFSEPYLNGESDVRWAADSMDYILYYQNAGLDQNLIQLGQNLFGPLVILWLAEGSNLFVLGINLAIYLVAWFVIVNNLDINKGVLFLALSVNPMLFVSLLAVNKEIVSFLVVALYAAYFGRRSIYYLAAALVTALFVRWQNVLIILLFELARVSVSPNKSRRFVVIGVLVFGLSIIYPSLDAQLGGVTTAEVDEQQANTTFGFLEVANNIQRNYGYFVVVVPKVLSNWFGNLPRAISVYLNPGGYDILDVYNTFVITGHQLAMVVIVFMLFLKRKFTLSNDLIFFSVFYSIVYSLGVLIQYRYYFPVYLILAIVLAQKGNKQLAESVWYSKKASVLP